MSPKSKAKSWTIRTLDTTQINSKCNQVKNDQQRKHISIFIVHITAHDRKLEPKTICTARTQKRWDNYEIINISLICCYKSNFTYFRAYLYFAGTQRGNLHQSVVATIRVTYLYTGPNFRKNKRPNAFWVEAVRERFIKELGMLNSFDGAGQSKKECLLCLVFHDIQHSWQNTVKKNTRYRHCVLLFTRLLQHFPCLYVIS